MSGILKKHRGDEQHHGEIGDNEEEWQREQENYYGVALQQRQVKEFPVQVCPVAGLSTRSARL